MFVPDAEMSGESTTWNERLIPRRTQCKNIRQPPFSGADVLTTLRWFQLVEPKFGQVEVGAALQNEAVETWRSLDDGLTLQGVALQVLIEVVGEVGHEAHVRAGHLIAKPCPMRWRSATSLPAPQAAAASRMVAPIKTSMSRSARRASATSRVTLSNLPWYELNEYVMSRSRSTLGFLSFVDA